jgi:hypothetical protein
LCWNAGWPIFSNRTWGSNTSVINLKINVKHINGHP